MDKDNSTQSDAIGNEYESSRVETMTTTRASEFPTRAAHPNGPNIHVHVDDGVCQPDSICNDHSNVDDDQNDDNKVDIDDQSEDDGDQYNPGYNYYTTGGREINIINSRIMSLMLYAEKDGEDTSGSDVDSVDSENYAYYNDYKRTLKRITYEYPSLENDIHKNYKYLMKELSSESLEIYHGCEQVNLDEIMLGNEPPLDIINIQRTFYFMCPPEGKLTRLQLDDPMDKYVSYIKANINEPIGRPNIIIKDPVPKDYLFDHYISSKPNKLSYYDVETFDDNEEQKTGKHQEELVANVPIIVAILQKKWYIAKTLLDLNADITRKSSSGRTAFHEAIRHNWVPFDVAEPLITDDNKDLQDEDGKTALHHLIKIVFDVRTSEINIFEKDFGFTADEYWKPRFDVVRALCERGADVNICDAFGSLPLHMALYCDFCNIHPETLKLLVTENNVNTADRFGCTPLHLAVRNRLWDLAEFFITKGADVEVTTDDLFPLHMALWFAEDDIPSNLLEQLVTDSNINEESPFGEPLYIATLKHHYQNIRTLVAHGADINEVVNCSGEDFPTALHAYVYFGNKDSPSDIVLLLASQEHINERYESIFSDLELEDETPLLLALKPCLVNNRVHTIRCMHHCVPEFIKAGADINMKKGDTTPLLRALAFEDKSEPPLDIIKMLVSTEIVNAWNGKHTAFRRAFETERWELIQVLLQYGADGPDVRGVVAAARTVSHDPHEGGRFDEKTDSLVDITVDIIRDYFLPGFSDDDFCTLKDMNYIKDEYILTVKRDHLYCAVACFKNSSTKERKDLMNLILTDYEDGERL